MSLLKFLHRRIRHLVALSILIAVICFILAQYDTSLRRTSYITGWSLASIVLLLTCYNLRKRLTFLPILGSSRAWMQIHIYFGILAVVVFLFHIGFRVPDGRFEQSMAALFLFVSASGFYGLYITRVVPKKLTAVSGEYIYEQIPQLRRKIRNQAVQIVEECSPYAPSLAQLYLDKLAAFFDRPRGVLFYAVPNGRTRRSLMLQLNNMDRYLPEEGHSPKQKLIDLVSQKDDLDYHYAMQGRLKLWLFVHIGTTYSMIVFAVFHTVMVHAFHGGLR